MHYAYNMMHIYIYNNIVIGHEDVITNDQAIIINKIKIKCGKI